MSVFFFFLACFLVRICFQVDVDKITQPPPPLSAPMFFIPTHNSLFNTSDTELFEISARLKLASVDVVQ